MKKKHTNKLLKWEEIMIRRRANNFIGRLEREEGATMFFILEESEETTFEFAQNAATVFWFWLRIKMETQKFCKFIRQCW